MLIGIVGLIGSGKDTVAQRLVEKHGYVRDSFAKSLKDAVSSMFNWDREMLEGDTTSSRHWREQPDKFWSERFGKPVTPRWVCNISAQKSCVDTCMMPFGLTVALGGIKDKTR